MTEAEFRQKDLEFRSRHLEFTQAQIRHNLEMLERTQAHIELVQDYRAHMWSVPDPEPPPTAPKPLDLSKPLEVVTKQGDIFPANHVAPFSTVAGPAVAVIFDDFFRCERFSIDGEQNGPFTLRNVPEPEPEKLTLDMGWVNVYRTASGPFACDPYATKARADEAATNGRIACLHITREFKVGEGLE